MDGIDRITSIPGVRIELYPLVDAPLAHEHQQQRRRQTEAGDGHELAPSEDQDPTEDDNGAYDDHGHLIHEHGEEPPSDIPHINIVV